MKPLFRILLIPLAGTFATAGPVLDKRALLEEQTFWSNQDFDWYAENIPFFDCPDEEINTTYYYRWELVTRHLVYGNPNTGYAFTEFANRPFWSGAYGTIACPAGLQISEVRWLNNPRYARDFVRFWMRHPGAQPRNYSFWAADSAWNVHAVSPDEGFITDLLPDLVKNYEGWEARAWVEDMGMFWQLGHDDGMEFDINAQQTNDILRGGQSFRPSFNTYMWADARAIARIAELANDGGLAEQFSRKAARIKSQVEEKLWDPSRGFFFPMSNQRHEKNGHVVEKHTLTYETGKYAGNPHGRELHGYVPWAFGMPSPGYESAWQFLMDEDFFMAKFGPTTVEQGDPLFVLKDSCCWWSGHSWPFATTQTLKAMANLLQRYNQDFVSRKDYAELLHTFAISQRKDGKPYIAEAVHPFTGSWEHHDFANRSEHYFHSGFVDLIVTGLAGLQPTDDDTITVKPLAPQEWSYFALDGLHYHGHLLSILWDREGTRYGKGKGLQLMVDGETVASSLELGTLVAKLPGGSRGIPVEENPPMNYAVNNDGDYYPRYSASSVGPHSALAAIGDGQYKYDRRPANRWTAVGSPKQADWIELDLGVGRPVDTVKLYLLDDGEGSSVRPPAKIRLEFWNRNQWETVSGAETSPGVPQGRKPYTFRFPTIETSKLRAHFYHADGSRSGITEFEAWGAGQLPYVPPRPPEGNFAYSRTPGTGFPKATASFSDRYGGVPECAIDGRIIYATSPTNRWTSYGSPNAEKDWLAVDFGESREVGKVVLHIFDDGGGVQAPKNLAVQYWTGSGWADVREMEADPDKPVGGMANTLIFETVETAKIRVVFAHIGQGDTRSGVTEIEVWKPEAAQE